MPVLIRWDVNAGQKIHGAGGVLSILEPVVVQYADMNTTCQSVNWDDPARTYVYMGFDAGNGFYERAALSFIDEAGTTLPKSDICFSPRGRAFIRKGGVLTQLTSVPTFTVVNSANLGGTGFVRTIFIPPNGVARMAQ